MIKLIKKELALAMHPTTIIFLFFATFVFIPNYPYEVMFFFSTLSVFFTCLTARENGDLFFTCSLPIKKGDAAKARIITTIMFQLILVALTAVCVVIKAKVLPMNNEAGMEANAAFIGVGLIILGIFNITFFSLHYKNPNKVGVPFLITSIITFSIIIAEIILCVAVPFVRDYIDTLNADYIWYRIAVLIIGIVVYLGLTSLSCLVSSRRLESVDL